MAQSSEKFMKRLYGPTDLFQQLTVMLAHIKDLRPVEGKDSISKQFVERVMMAVTEVNGCRYCSYFHAQVALKEGVTSGEVDQLLSGSFEDAPKKEVPALFFAQHYAESGGDPQAEAVQSLKDTYGDFQARQIMEYIRMIMIGNTTGNGFDALRTRLKGNPAPDSTLGKELGVIFGVVWMVPVILVKKLFTKKPAASEV
jgi:AhpD family alkylhydroperoxidase